MSSRLRRFLPLVVAALALGLVLSRMDYQRLMEAMRQAPITQLLLVSAAGAVLNCGADTLAMLFVFRWFGLSLRFFDLYTIRAATYTLAVINYHLGQLGIIGFLHRVGKVPLAKASGWVLFIVGVWVGLLLLIASLAALLGGPQGAALWPVLALFGAGMVVYVTLLLWQPPWLRDPEHALAAVGLSPKSKERAGPLGKVLIRVWTVLVALLQPLLAVGILGHIRALVVRLPHLTILTLWHFFALRCFGVQVPLSIAVLYLPVIFAVGSLPISVQGLGTTQLAADYFFTPFAPGGKEAVLAYSLSMTGISILSNLTLGLLFLRRGAALGLSTTAPVPIVEADTEDKN